MAGHGAEGAVDGDAPQSRRKKKAPTSEPPVRPAPLDRRERGHARQAARREAENQARHRILALCERMQATSNLSQRAAASIVGLSPACLSAWRGRARKGSLQPKALGRPARQEPMSSRANILGLVHFIGPGVGVETLRFLLPHVARDELRSLLLEYRRGWREHHQRQATRLTWTRVGAVWAMDFATPPAPVDGVFTSLLAVRDLASGQTLLWQPLVRATGHTVCCALRKLFEEHGAPLVLKEDNATVFRTPEVRSLLQAHGVRYLRSPVRSPWYNGSIEAGINTLKRYTEHQAARHGRMGQWTGVDVENARRIANALGGAREPQGPRASTRWAARTRISRDERCDFLRQVDRNIQALLAMRQSKEEDLDDRQQATLERQAVSLALEEGGFLLFSRKRISPPIKAVRCLRIT